jgi:hypothetical protein
MVSHPRSSNTREPDYIGAITLEPFFRHTDPGDAAAY